MNGWAQRDAEMQEDMDAALTREIAANEALRAENAKLQAQFTSSYMHVQQQELERLQYRLAAFDAALVVTEEDIAMVGKANTYREFLESYAARVRERVGK